jgi:hypothetical protein
MNVPGINRSILRTAPSGRPDIAELDKPLALGQLVVK